MVAPGPLVERRFGERLGGTSADPARRWGRGQITPALALDHHHLHHHLHFSAPRKLVEKSNLPSSHLTSGRCSSPSLMCYSKGSSAWRDLGMPTMSLSDGIGMGAILNIRRIPTLSPQLHSIAPTHFLRLARPHLQLEWIHRRQLGKIVFKSQMHFYLRI